MLARNTLSTRYFQVLRNLIFINKQIIISRVFPINTILLYHCIQTFYQIFIYYNKIRFED